MDAETMKKVSLAILMCLSTAVVFAQDAGTVIFASGSVTAERQPPVALGKGDAVRVQDTVVTGEASRAQLLMIDSARIALRPNSRLKIEEYDYDAAPMGGAVTTRNDRGVTSLLKGGFRTITGAIGKQDEKDYEVRTAVGVLGIRGTDYTAVFCNADCSWAPGIAAGRPLEDGLYLGVNDGIVLFRNENGDIVLQAGQYAFVPLSDRRLRQLAEPPAVLMDDLDPGQEGSGSAQQSRPSAAAPGFDSKLGTRRAPSPAELGADDETSEGKGGRDAPGQSVIGVNPDGTPVDITPGSTPAPNGQRTISWSTGPAFGPSTLYSGTLANNPTQYRLDTGNNLVGFANEIPGRTGVDVAAFDIASSGNVDAGFDSLTVLRWGRWSGGTAGITLSDGTDASIDLATQSLHWVSGPESASAPLMPVTGVANYSLVGGTNPTDNFGNVGVLGNASFSADFTNMLVDTTLQIDINSTNWLAAGQGTIGIIGNQPVAPHIFGGSYNSVIIDGVTGGGGTFSGFFSDPGQTSDPGFPGGAGMTFSIQDGSDTTQVSGALVFGNP